LLCCFSGWFPICAEVFGLPACTADVLVVRQLADDTFASQADAITDLLWDHWLGESDEPSHEAVRDHVVAVCRFLTEHDE
jgi:hypothetical protein